MALNDHTTTQDISVYKRNLPRDYIGTQFCWTRFKEKDRLKTFLQRNMNRSQNVHAKRVKRQRQSAPAAPRPSLRDSFVNGEPRRSSLLIVSGGSSSNGAHPAQPAAIREPSTDTMMIEHDTSISRTDAISRDTLEVRAMPDQYNSANRRSVRQKLVQQRDDPDLELYINPRCIRKKLNWKTNRFPDGQKPRKRARLDDIECHVHLTIWACLQGTKNADWKHQFEHTESCTMQRDNLEADPVKGRFIRLRMERPFRIPKRALRREVYQGGQRSLEMATRYFMEVKIVPKSDSVHDWPPIPVLTRAAIEAQDLESQARQTLDDCLVASYHRLPEPPDMDTPLSICHLKGLTLDTKYGLEIEARWQPPSHSLDGPKFDPADDEKLEAWMKDDDGKPFGRADLSKKRSVSQMARKSAPASKHGKSGPVVSSQPLVHYTFEARGKREIKGFRTASVEGLACQACPVKPWKTVEELLLHLENMHHELLFSLENTKTNEISGRLEVSITIERPVVKASEKLKKEEGDFLWIAPEAPFDIKTHTIDDDKSWLGKEYRPRSRKGPQKSTVQITTDEQTGRRKEHNGHLPSRHVQPFRPKEYQRKRFPIIRLRTQREEDSIPYTSISHRQTLPGHEEDRSETDDEADDSWFIDHQLEELDIHAREQNWSVARHALAKRWNDHVIRRERTVHSRYMSDCLIRFVRIERAWLLSADPGAEDDTARMEALIDLLDDLTERRVINDAVSQDVLSMLYTDEVPAIPSEEMTEIEAQLERQESLIKEQQAAQDVTNEMIKVSRLSLDESEPYPVPPQSLAGPIPPEICARCGNQIINMQRAVRCSDVQCTQAGLFWHARCAGLDLASNEQDSNNLAQQTVRLDTRFMKERLSWRCGFCRSQGEEKGKEVAR